ncbi:MAG: ATP synthase F1 subunit delta [Sphingobacteriaceae bacterium]|nr:ATP synthase F1 subunit delta [Sphingobacteriaceae bacterium]
MQHNKAASRYAKSLIDLSTENNALEDLKNDMQLFIQVVQDNDELEAILKNPIVPLAKKSAILTSLFTGKVNKITMVYFDLAVKKGRSAILLTTAKQFVEQYNVLKGIVTAEITTATPVTEDHKKVIVEMVKNALKASQVLIKEKINTNLIGGFILKVGDKQFDTSIATGLNKLKKEFAHLGA